MEKRKFKKGELICQEGTTGNDMFVILSGQVNIYKTINAEKIFLSVLKPKDFLGEMCLLLNMPRSATAEAQTDTEVTVLSKNHLLTSIQKNPQFALNMLTVMAKRLTEAHSVISNIEGMKKSMEILYKSRSK